MPGVHKRLTNSKREGIYIAGAALLILLLFNIPWLPEDLVDGLDSAWITMLHKAFISKMQFGQDIIWHYGPLGFLFGKYYFPETYIFMLYGWVILSAIFFAELLFTAPDINKNPLVPIALTAIAVLTHDAFFISLPLMLLLYFYSSKPEGISKLLIFFIAGTAVIGLVKISYLIVGFFVILTLELARLLNKQRPFIFLSIYLSTLLVAWVLCGQSPANLLPYLRGGLELAFGFTAMSHYNKPFWLIVISLLPALSYLWIISSAMFKKDGKKALPLISGLTFITYSSIKIGFINDNDHHILQYLSVFLFMLLLSKDFFWRDINRRQKVTLSAIFVVVVIVISLSALYRDISAIKSQISEISGSYNAGSFTPQLSAEKTRYELLREGLKNKYNFPAMEGSVDLYNYSQMPILTGDFDYKPRPVFQSYHAYTPYLARLNRNHLKSAKAADNILFGMEEILNRHPAADDALSWPELLTRYKAKGTYGSFLHLVKKEKPDVFTLKKLSEKTINMGQKINLPEDIIWAKIFVEKNILGEVFQLLFKEIPVEITFSLKSGKQASNRIIQATAGEGFLLSPLVADSKQFALLLKKEESFLRDNALYNISLNIEKDFPALSSILFKDEIRVEFYELDFPGE